jgi:hypothetical protein
MFRTMSITLLTVSALACGSGGANRHVASPEARAIKFTEWSKRDATAPLWPASAKRVQVVVTGGYAEGDHMVWVVSEGTTLLVVYRVAAADYGDALANIVRPTIASPLADFSDGGQGIILGPPPPPPVGPIGFPESVINAVIDYTSRIDVQSQQLGRELGAAATH